MIKIIIVSAFAAACLITPNYCHAAFEGFSDNTDKIRKCFDFVSSSRNETSIALHRQLRYNLPDLTVNGLDLYFTRDNYLIFVSLKNSGDELYWENQISVNFQYKFNKISLGFEPSWNILVVPSYLTRHYYYVNPSIGWKISDLFFIQSGLENYLSFQKETKKVFLRETWLSSVYQPFDRVILSLYTRFPENEEISISIYPEIKFNKYLQIGLYWRDTPAAFGVNLMVHLSGFSIKSEIVNNPPAGWSKKMEAGFSW